MNAKKAKALRRIAGRVAAGAGLPAETQYLQQRRSGQVVVGRSVRGLARELKRRIARGEIRMNASGQLTREAA